jgi:hypothetical protein
VSERYIDIVGWDRFQHKDIWRKSGGRPPWIKNYTRLLHDDRYLSLTMNQRGVLHGLWLMYASGGRSVNETLARRLLSTNKTEARHWRGSIESLRNAGFIEVSSQSTRAPVAPRVEESREEESTYVLSGEKPKTRTPTEAEIVAAREARENAGWVDDLGQYTGCRYVRGEVGIHAVYDPLGKEFPPSDWPYQRPTKQEVVAAQQRANSG